MMKIGKLQFLFSAPVLIVMALNISATNSNADSLIGQQAPEWEGVQWLGSEGTKLSDLRGKVVLVRWWTAPQCPYCRNSAPALNEFHSKYAENGLRVIGFYHHKSSAPLDPQAVARQAREFGFEFPIAIDPSWRTLEKWWLNSNKRGWTSVSFLLDRKGVIRFIHPGGQYVKGDDDYAALKAKIEELLREPTPGAAGSTEAPR